jgi:hypothetical protein
LGSQSTGEFKIAPDRAQPLGGIFMTKALDSRLLEQFIKLAGEKLTGEWLLVGGTLLPAVGIDIRSTVDIDIVSLGGGGGDSQLKIMELAESLGLPVESVNQAASFFVKRAGYQKSDLIVLHKGKSATIFRPSLELYWKLKLARLSETDVQDCLEYFNFCKQVNDPISFAKLSQLLAAEKKSGVSNEKKVRINELTLLAQGNQG